MTRPSQKIKAGDVPVSAESEKLALECEKLRAEIAELRKPKSLADQISRHSVLVSMLVALLGFGFGIYQYRDQQVKNREQERNTHDRDFMKPLWERQLQTYFEASEAAATIATTTDADARAKALNKFWMLYHGPLVIVESPAVSGAMKAFGAVLNGKTREDLMMSYHWPLAIVESSAVSGAVKSPGPEFNGKTRETLKVISLALASAFQESLIEGANLRLDNFRKSKFDYRP